MVVKLIISFAWVGAILYILHLRGILGPRISQDVELELDGNFCVSTCVWFNDRIEWSHYTFQDVGLYKGLPLNKIDSAKKHNYELAKSIVVKLKLLD